MGDKETELGAAPYVIAGISFFPLLGIPFGVASILWAIFTKKKGRHLLAILGISGILFTPFVYGIFYYKVFVEKGGIYDKLWTDLARRNLNELVSLIEIYKIENGGYPISLTVLKNSLDSNKSIIFQDPTQDKTESDKTIFFYEVVDDDHFYIRGLGADRVPFTDDDILPSVPGPRRRSGLLIERSMP